MVWCRTLPGLAESDERLRIGAGGCGGDDSENRATETNHCWTRPADAALLQHSV